MPNDIYHTPKARICQDVFCTTFLFSQEAGLASLLLCKKTRKKEARGLLFLFLLFAVENPASEQNYVQNHKECRKQHKAKNRSVGGDRC